jgi:transketolase
MSKRYPAGRNIYFGVREHAMAAILNGISLSGLKVFGSCFLTFSDYLIPAMRMTCLMNLPVTYVFTHDSASIGSDGPSHQPVEQMANIRNIPNMIDFRPCDINEVIGSWEFITHNSVPTSLFLSKDEAHILAGTNGKKVAFGAYILRSEKIKLDAVLVSTGIDITTTYLISEELRAKGIDTRVVSMPSMKLFKRQSEEYRNSVLPPYAKIITIEAGSTMCWNYFSKYNIGIDEFGYSGKKEEILEKLKFDYESILEKIIYYITGKMPEEEVEPEEPVVDIPVNVGVNNQLEQSNTINTNTELNQSTQQEEVVPITPNTPTPNTGEKEAE